eukprot:CAMPEP_0183333788 /NCGR_PEP_ID=MMETSP0164_2-20130417/2586_1 /TAXON_ID=221442 /ORGANISM="Coccolithus pelagicus ssp braarudi, Strain PLY182g" /LENGTH=121 /DNA_ID=CAMNT_0025502793 /DNA_START=149 /DNA_END=515 /DNA_ORIENTATION=-
MSKGLATRKQAHEHAFRAVREGLVCPHMQRHRAFAVQADERRQARARGGLWEVGTHAPSTHKREAVSGNRFSAHTPTCSRHTDTCGQTPRFGGPYAVLEDGSGKTPQTHHTGVRLDRANLL